MTFADLVLGTSVFLDSNTFVYFFSANPMFRVPCEQLLLRIERQELQGYANATVLSEVAHRLMTIEASTVLGWPSQGIAHRLKRHPAEVKRLNLYRRAIDEINLIGITLFPTTGQLVSLAVDVSRQTGLLSSDALIVSTMNAHGLTHLASNDTDFDRVPGLTRYSPV